MNYGIGLMVFWLVSGLLAGGLFLWAIQTQGPSSQRRWLAIGLIGVAAAYIVFSLVGGAGWPWLFIEIVGAAVYAALAVLGARRAPGWLALGWATHPLWDVVVHLLNRQAGFVPAWYALACASFDWTVAAYILFPRQQR